eukprot:8682028-Lingulodinium_polyedra.AAC.1
MQKARYKLKDARSRDSVVCFEIRMHWKRAATVLHVVVARSHRRKHAATGSSCSRLELRLSSRMDASG